MSQLYGLIRKDIWNFIPNRILAVMLFIVLSTISVISQTFQAPPTYVSTNTADPQTMVKIGDYLFTGHWGGGNPFKTRIEAYDISTPGTPVYAGQTDLGSLTGDANNGSVYDMEVANGYLYVTARYGEKLYIVDYSNPASLSVVGNYNFGTNTIPSGISVDANYAYVTVDQSLNIIDISNPASPSLTGSLSLGAWVDVKSNISKNGSYLYITGNNSLYVVDISNPATPSLSQTIASTGAYRNIIDGNYLYITKGAIFMVYDVSTPSNPTYQTEITVPNISSLSELDSDGSYLYLGANTSASVGALSVYDLSTPAAPSLVDQSSSSTKNVNHVVIGTGYLYTSDQNYDEIGTFQITPSCSPPSISGQPSASVNCTGESTAFSVSATGTTLTYQWRVDGGDISDGGVYSGATSATLNISDVSGLNGKSYDVVVTESGTCSSTSSTASLTVNAIPTITGTTPASRLCDGTVTLGATASAGTLNWYAASSGGSSLGTGTSFTTPSLSSTTSYYVDATANGCTTASRTAVTATINPLTDLAVSATASNILCEGSTTVTTISSDNGVNYYLRDNSDDSVIDGPVAGTGSGLSFNTGILSSTKTFNVYGELPGSGNLTFDGTDDFIDLGTGISFVGTSAYTVEARVKADNVSTPEKNVVSKHQFGTGNLEFLLRINNGKVVGGIRAGGTDSYITGTTTLVPGTWYDLAVTYDGSNLKVYVNGVEDGSTAKTGTVDANSANAYIGASFNGVGAGAEFYDGAIEEVRIWNVAKSGAEISSNLSTDFAGNESGLVALYEFSDGSGTTLSDETVNGHNGTLTNMSGTEWGFTTACTLEMTQTATVTIDPLTDLAVSATASNILCEGSTTITTTSSENGVNYYLRDNSDDSVIDGPIAGTGSGLSFNTGTISSSTTYNVFAFNEQTSNALELSGAGSQQATMSSFPLNNLSAFTLEAWVRYDGSGSGIEVFAGLGGSGTNYLFIYADGSMILMGNTASDRLQNTNPGIFPTDNNWHHVAFAQTSSGNGKIYIDGISQAITQNTFSGFGPDVTTNILSDSYPGNSGIDEIRFWNLERTASEINDNMNADLIGNESGLLALVEFEEGTGSTASDATVNGNDVTLSDVSTWGSRVDIICSLEMTQTATVTIDPLTDLAVSASESNILCEGSTTITTTSSDNGVNYYLRDNSDDSVIDGPVAGDGNGLSFNTGVLTNSKTFNVFAGTGSGALTFDGTDDFVDLGTGITFVGTSSYTIEARVNPDDITTPEKNIVAKHQFGTGNIEFLLRINNGKLVGGIFAGGSYASVTGTTTLSAGSWYDLAMTYDGSNLRIYVNGAEDGSVSKSGTIDANSANAYIGASYNGAGAGAEFFDGSISEVRIWNITKSEAELASNLGTDYLGSETGLVALYEFSDASGTTLSDETANGHNGTLNNMSGTEWSTDFTCSLEMTQTATVTIDPLTDLAVSATASNILCEGSTTITTTSSENGVNYYLRDNSDDSVIDGPIAGTGSGLSFNTGNINTSTTYNVYAAKEVGSNALDFDGIDDKLQVPNNPVSAFTEFTIEGWVKLDALGKYIASVEGFGGDYIHVFSDGHVACTGGSGGGSINTVAGAFPNDGQWHHFAFTSAAGAGGSAFYIDGTSVGLANDDFNFYSTTNNNYQILGEGTGTFTSGSLDEFRIWAHVRTESEIQAGMNSCLSGSESGLVMYLPFNEGTGSIATDESGNGNDANLIGMDGSSWIVNQVGCVDCELAMTQTATVTIDALTDQTYSVSATSVNAGDNVDFTINGSQSNVNYYLRNDANDTTFAGPIAGTGSAIVINTGTLAESITFNVYQEHTSTNCSAEMTQGTQTITVIPVTRHYVDTDAVGANDGSSWADAYTDLQSALAVADASDSVWVAAGTYYPTATTDRTIWFEPADGVEIYGGFAGTETDISQRSNFGVGGANETILSGDIGTQGVDTDNSQHVFNFIANNATNTLNGLTIAKGYTNGGPIAGGGIYFSATAATLHLTDVHLVDNYAAWDGAGMVSYGSTNVYMTRVSFTGGYAGEEGGGFELNSSGIVKLNQVEVMSNQARWEGAGGRITASSDLTIINSKFVGNEMTTTGRPYGGGIEIVNVTGSIVNTIISGNKSMNFGGGIRMANSVLDIINCTIVANEATGNGGGISISGGTLNLKNTIIWDNEHSNITGDQSASIYQEAAATINYTNSLVEAYNPGGTNLDGTNAGNDPLFTSAVDLSVTATPTTSGDFSIQNSSPAKDAGDNALLPADEFDLDSDSDTVEELPVDLVFNNRSTGAVDMGSYENLTSNQAPTLTAFSGAVDTGNEDEEIEITFTELQTSGDENDSDGTVDAFKVKSVATGTLKIGASSGAAIPFSVSTNDVINASLNAYWIPAADANGSPLNAFEVVTVDNDGAESTLNVMATVNVSAVNDAPIFSASGDVTVSEDFSTTETVTVTPGAVHADEAGQTVTYSLSPASVSFANVTINSSTGEVTITAVVDSVGTQLFTITADDAQGANNTHDETFTLTVNSVNDAPTFTTSGDVTVSEDFGTTETVTITPDAVPADEVGQTVTYSLSPASVAFANVSINSSTGEVSITAVADASGSQLFTITADDAQGANSTHDETFTLTVNSVNDAPTFTTNGDVTVSEDFGTTETVTITPDAVPADEVGQTVTYSLSPASVAFANVSINSNTGEVSITAVADASGSQLFTITANDAQGANNTHEETFTLTVNAVNDAPTFTTSGDVTVSEDFGTTETVTVTPGAVPADEAGQTVTYSLSPASVAFANVSINSSTGEVSITAVGDGTGSQLFTITANDAQGANNTHDETFTLTVNSVNDAPAFTTTGDVTFSEDFGTTESVTVSPSAVPSDESGQTVTYSLSPSSVAFANVSINTNTGEVTITALADASGSQLFTITANDAQGANNTHDETFTLTVNAVNDAPAFITSGDVTVSEDFGTTESITVTPSAVPSDESGQTVTYSLSPSSVAFANVTINSSTGEVSITAVGDGTGSQLFTITADDAQGANSTHDETFTLTVNSVNDEPTFTTSGDITVSEDFGTTETVTVTPEAVPANEAGQTVTYSLSPSSVAFANVSINSSTGEVSITAVGDGTGSQLFTITSDDAQGANNTHDETFTLTVNAVNDAPTVDANNGLTLDEGAMLIISTSELSASDVDNTANELTYTITLSPVNGIIVKSADTNTAITSFTQVELAANEILYKHDDTETTSDSFNFVVSDNAGGSATSNTFAITITPVDDTAPIISTLSPVDGATGVAGDGGTFSITFSESIAKGSGNINFKRSTDNSLVGVVDVSSTDVSISGATASVNPNFDLGCDEDVYIEFGSGVFEDVNANAFVGIASGAWSFTSYSAPEIQSGAVVISGNTFCTGGSNGSLDATNAIHLGGGSSDASNYSFQWYEGAGTGGATAGTTASIGSLASGSYTLVVTHISRGCESNPVTLTVADDFDDPPVIDSSITNLTDCAADNGAISATASSTSEPADYTFKLYEGVGTGGTVLTNLVAAGNVGFTSSSLASGSYTIEAINNSTSCNATQTVTVNDDRLVPTINSGSVVITHLSECGTGDGSIDISAAIEESGITQDPANYSITWYQGSGTGGTVIGSSDGISGQSDGVYTVEAVNNSSSCSLIQEFTLNIDDQINPTVITQDITVQLDAAGTATIATTDIDNGSSDACGILSQSLDLTAFDCSHIGTPQTVTLTVTDNNGNVNTATATVTVQDTVLPTVVTQDITVQLDAAGAATIATTDIDNGSSDACGVLSQSLDVTAFDCSHIGTPQTVTLTVTDNNGNVNTATATVTVQDTVLPTVVTQDITVQLDAAGAATIATTDIDNGSSDNCGIASQTLDVTDFDCSHVGTPQTVTLTVTDSNGNVNTATATVTVQDTVLPTVVTQDITVQLDAAGAATIATTDIDNGSSDACGILSQSLDVTAFDCSHIGTPQTVTLTVTDNNGNVNTATATVTVQDTELPTVVTQDITVQLDAAGAATIATTDIDNGSSDACGVLSQSLDMTAFDCSHVGTPQTVTLTVTDNNGNVNTATATVTVQDTVLPTVVTQDITVQLDAAGAATIATTDIDNGSSDACGISSQSLDVTAFDCSHVGTPQTVTLTVTDSNGNVNTATATVTVQDTVLPTVVTQDITVQLDAAGAATIATTDIDNGSSDNCGIASQTLDVTDFDCSHVGTPQTVTLTVTDSNGNVNTATATVTVQDTVLPTVVTQDITVQLDAAGAATIATTDIDNGSSDNCGIASQTLDVTDFDCSHVGTPQTVTLTVTDSNGNVNTATATVTVQDTVLPTVVTQDITVELDVDGLASISTTDIDNGSSDSCGIASQSLDVTDFDCSHVGTPQTVTLTVTDNNGNVNTATATVTVQDTVLPTVVTQDITVQLDAAGAATIATTDIDNGSSDACGILSQSLDVTAFDCSHVGTPQTVTLTVTDNNGNVNTATATVTVQDTELPTVVTQDITVQLDAAGAATIATTDIDNGSSDNCGIASQTLDVTDFDCSHVGTPQTVTLTVTDSNGNVNTATATVTVQDTVLPTVVTQDITVQLDAAGAATIATTDIDNGSSDNCGIASQTLDVTDFDCSHVGTPQTVTLTVTDNNGNVNTATATVTVQDTVLPTVVTQDITVQLDAAGAATIATTDIDNGSSDACGISSQSLDVTAFDCSHVGTPQTVTLTVTDNNGNVNTATATVTVQDTELPTVVTQDITVQLDAAGAATIATTDIDNGSSDNCGIASQTLDVTDFDCSHVGTPQTVTLTVTDSNGNVNTATATVTVQDTVLPTVVTQDITVQLDAAGAATIATTDIDNGSSDNCGIASQTLDVTDFDCSHVGTPQTVTLTVTDNNGNVNTATATVTVQDTVLPTVVTQDITVQLDAAGAATIATTDIDNGSSDACGVLSQSLDMTAFDCSHVGTPQTVTLTVTDNNGNVNTATATVTVQDTVLPTVVTQDITVQLDAAGAATIATTDIDNGSSDACGISSQSLDVTAFDCSHVGTPQTVTLTVTDSNGNVNTATATVTVQDTVLPTVVTQDITVQLDAAGAATIATTDIDNGSSDACGILSQSLDVTAFDCSHIGTPQTVTLTVTDNNGNVNTATATVTVQDTELPTVVTQDITVQLDAAGAATIATTDIDNGSSDACGILSQSLDVTAFDCSHVGTPQTVTLTVTDNNGNVNTATATVTVQDTVLPTVVTQDITVQLDAAGAATIATTDIDNGSSDNCGIASQTLDVADFDCSHVGTPQTVTLTVTDSNGNVNTATATVTVQDTVLPTVVTQDITVELDVDGLASISTTDIDNGSSDNCGIGSQSLDVTDFDCSHVGTPQVVTLTVTDNHGNSNTATAMVTVSDNALPTVVTQDITVQLDATGAATIATSDIDNGSSDACGISSQSLDVTAFDCSHVGTPQVVTLTVTDNHGNSNTATAMVTVSDNALPTVVTQDITVELDVDGLASISTTDIDNGSSDNCGIASQSLDVTDFDCSHVGTPQTVTLTVTDSNGNVNTATATVTVQDTELPTVVTQDITVELDVDGLASISTTDIDNGSSDNCGIASQSLDVTDFDCSHVGTPQVVTLTVTDNHGNSNTATATVTVSDNVSPLAIGKDVQLYLDENGNASITAEDLDNGSSDACGELTFQASQTDFSCSETANSTSISFDKVDDYLTVASGGSVFSERSVWTFESWVYIPDTEEPATQQTYTLMSVPGTSAVIVIFSSGLIQIRDFTNTGSFQSRPSQYPFDGKWHHFAVTNNGSEGSGSIYIDGEPVELWYNSFKTWSSMNTQEMLLGSWNNDANSFFKGELDEVRFWSTSRTQAEIQQGMNKSLTGNEAGLELYYDFEFVDGSTVSDVSDHGYSGMMINMSSDNLNDAGSPVSESTVEVTLTVTDGNNNSASTLVNVELLDSIAPIVGTKDITIYLDTDGGASIVPESINDASTDVCGTFELTLDRTTFDCNDIGEQTVVLSATDNSGNVASKTAVVTVLDTLAPVFAVRDVTVVLDDTGNGTILIDDIVVSQEECLTFTASKTTFDCSDPTLVEISIVGQDAGGNETSKSIVVTVNDDASRPDLDIVTNSPVQCEGGTINMTPVTAVTGTAIRFGGGSSNIVIPDDDRLDMSHTDAYTIEMWFRPENTARGTLYSKMANVAPFKGLELYYQNGQVGYHLINQWSGNALWGTTTGTYLSPGSWYHVAFIYNGRSATIVVNGQKRNQQIHANRLSATTENDIDVHIGNREGSAYQYIGSIDELRVWDHSRTIEQIARMKDHRLSGGQGLLLHYDFEGIDSNEIKDRSAEGNHGLFRGNVQFVQRAEHAMDTSNYVYEWLSQVDYKVSKAASFDGENDYITVVDKDAINGRTSGTLEMWVKWNGDKQDAGYGGLYGAVLGKQRNGLYSNCIIGLNHSDPTKANIVWRPFNAYKNIIVSSATLDYQWHHLVITFEPGLHKMYLDGNLMGSAAVNSRGMRNDPKTPLTLGAWIDGGDSYAQADLDEFRIWNRVLSSEEVLKNHGGFDLTESHNGLSLYYDFQGKFESGVVQDKLGKQNGAPRNGVSVASRQEAVTETASSLTGSVDFSIEQAMFQKIRITNKATGCSVDKSIWIDLGSEDEPSIRSNRNPAFCGDTPNMRLAMTSHGGGGATAFQWYHDGYKIDGEVNSYIDVTEKGNYTLEVTNSTGCQVVSNAINVRPENPSGKILGDFSQYVCGRTLALEIEHEFGATFALQYYDRRYGTWYYTGARTPNPELTVYYPGYYYRAEIRSASGCVAYTNYIYARAARNYSAAVSTLRGYGLPIETAKDRSRNRFSFVGKTIRSYYNYSTHIVEYLWVKDGEEVSNERSLYLAEPGTYTLIVRDKDSGCEYESEIIKVYEGPTITLESEGGETEVCGSEIQLTATLEATADQLAESRTFWIVNGRAYQTKSKTLLAGVGKYEFAILYKGTYIYSNSIQITSQALRTSIVSNDFYYCPPRTYRPGVFGDRYSAVNKRKGVKYYFFEYNRGWRFIGWNDQGSIRITRKGYYGFYAIDGCGNRTSFQYSYVRMNYCGRWYDEEAGEAPGLSDTTEVARTVADAEHSEPIESTLGGPELVQVTLSPQPADDVLTIDILSSEEENREEMHVELYDVSGRLMKTSSLNNMYGGLSQSQINVSDLAGGVYLYKIKSADSSIENGRIIINRK